MIAADGKTIYNLAILRPRRRFSIGRTGNEDALGDKSDQDRYLGCSGIIYCRGCDLGNKYR